MPFENTPLIYLAIIDDFPTPESPNNVTLQFSISETALPLFNFILFLILINIII